MDNFVFDIKTKAYFGKDQIKNLGEILKQYGKKVLFVYGKGSIKQNGIYSRIMEIADENNLEIVEFGGVEPNPLLSTAKRGIDIAKSQKVDCILAVGGGSAIDCAKAIGIGAKYDGDVWDFYSYTQEIKDSLPVVGIVTLAASGTEMSSFSVLTNNDTMQKNGASSRWIALNESILDPEYTFSVNAFHSACGVVDAMSHTLEGYFANSGSYISERLRESVLKTLIKFGPQILENPKDYEARAEILWASSLALNGLLTTNVTSYPNECHMMGQALSAKYDITHGLSLALVHIKWYEFCLKNGKIEKFAQFGRNVFGLSGEDKIVAKEAIEKLNTFFFDTMKLPKSMKEAGYETKPEELKELAIMLERDWNSKNWYIETTSKNIEEIYNQINN